MSNALNRLLWWHILLIGVGASLILAIILYFAMIKPKGEELASTKADADSTEQNGGTQQQVDSNKKKLADAKKDTIRINQQWEQDSHLYMPALAFGPDMLVNYENKVLVENGKPVGVRDLPTTWGRWVTLWYESQAKAGITLPQGMGFPIAAFPADPNKISSLTSLSFPQDKPWHVTVMAKSFDQAMAHLKRINGLYRHGMPVIDNVALSGQSPDLQMDYDLIFYIIPPSQPPAADAKIGGAAGGGGGNGPAGFGGPGGPGFSSFGPAGPGGGSFGGGGGKGAGAK